MTGPERAGRRRADPDADLPALPAYDREDRAADDREPADAIPARASCSISRGCATAADEGTKVLLFCNPHNPTGRVYTREELQAIGDLAVERDLVIVSDEVHADLIFSGHKHIPMAHPQPGDRRAHGDADGGEQRRSTWRRCRARLSTSAPRNCASGSAGALPDRVIGSTQRRLASTRRWRRGITASRGSMRCWRGSKPTATMLRSSSRTRCRG